MVSHQNEKVPSVPCSGKAGCYQEVLASLPCLCEKVENIGTFEKLCFILRVREKVAVGHKGIKKAGPPLFSDGLAVTSCCSSVFNHGFGFLAGGQKTDKFSLRRFFLIIFSYMVLKTAAGFFFVVVVARLLLVFFLKNLLFIFDCTGSSLLHVGYSLAVVR